MTQHHHESASPPEASNDKNATSPLYFVVAALLWSVTIATLGYWHYNRVAAGFQATAIAAARQSIEKDKIYRLWAAKHGGVYVPTSEQTPANPYLAHILERDITTPSGRPLTLMNPAYMTRQVHELASELFGSRGKITSLDPLRPENRPDAWEMQALLQFAAGESEYSSLELMEGETFLRVMSPFYAESPCLHCHASQGYQIGDLVGGIAVAIPWQPYHQAYQQAWVGYGFGYGGVWIMGLVLLEGHRRRLRLYLEHRRQSEQRQRELLVRLQKLAAHLPGMIYQFQLNADGSFCLPYASDALCSIYDVHPEEVKVDATAIFAAVHPRDRAELITSIKHSANTLGAWKSLHRVLRPSGNVIWVEGHSTPERLPDGSTLWHGFAQDISTRKQAQDLLEQQKTQLEQRNRALRQFSYAVSHELKTPLVSIESSLGLIQNSLPQTTDPEVTNVFGYARTATRQMNNLLESLLLMFRIDTADYDKEATAFSVLVQDAIDQLTRGSKLEGIKLTIAKDGPELCGDRNKLVQIWLHLIGNAAKYMGDQKYPMIDIGAELIAQEIQFFVRDNGMGIEQSYHGKIFGLFDRLDKTADGTGLGLTLVKRIVEYYGGTIRIESAGAGHGSCFYFTLPDVLNLKDTRS
jgi:PAS domain S-box-containing protein